MTSAIEQTQSIKPWQISAVLGCITLFYITYISITFLSIGMSTGIELASLNLTSQETQTLAIEIIQKVIT